MGVFFLFTGLLAMSVNVLLGIAVYSANPHKIQNNLFAVLTTTFVVWILGSTMMHLSADYASLLFWARYSYLGLIFLAAIFFHFSFSFDRAVLPLHIYLPAIFFSQVSLSTDILIRGVAATGTGYSILYGFAGRYFLVYLLAYALVGLFHLLSIEQRISRLNRARLNLIAIGVSIPLVFGLLIEVALPYLGYPTASVIEYLTIPMAISIFYAFFGFEKEFK